MFDGKFITTIFFLPYVSGILYDHIPACAKDGVHFGAGLGALAGGVSGAAALTGTALGGASLATCPTMAIASIVGTGGTFFGAPLMPVGGFIFGALFGGIAGGSTGGYIQCRNERNEEIENAMEYYILSHPNGPILKDLRDNTDNYFKFPNVKFRYKNTPMKYYKTYPEVYYKPYMTIRSVSSKKDHYSTTTSTTTTTTSSVSFRESNLESAQFLNKLMSILKKSVENPSVNHEKELDESSTRLNEDFTSERRSDDLSSQSQFHNYHQNNLNWYHGNLLRNPITNRNNYHRYKEDLFF